MRELRRNFLQLNTVSELFELANVAPNRAFAAALIEVLSAPSAFRLLPTAYCPSSATDVCTPSAPTHANTSRLPLRAIRG